MGWYFKLSLNIERAFPLLPRHLVKQRIHSPLSSVAGDLDEQHSNPSYCDYQILLLCDAKHRFLRYKEHRGLLRLCELRKALETVLRLIGLGPP